MGSVSASARSFIVAFDAADAAAVARLAICFWRA
jgi:hypothetical protein